MATTTRPPRDDERASPPGPSDSIGRGGANGALRSADGGSTVPDDRAPLGAMPSTPHPAASARAAVPLEEIPAPRRKGRLRLLLVAPILLVVGGAALLLAYRYWYESTYFVITDNAQITGDLVQVGSLNAGRIVASRLEVGAPVRSGQELAVLAMPQQVGSTVAGAAPRMDVVATNDTLVSVQSPVDGVVAARTGFVGATVQAGQPIYMIVDPRKAWIRANIEESKVWMVRPGQQVAIHVDALNRDIIGRVAAITLASAATFSLLPTGNVSGNFVKVTQYIPVKILADDVDTILPLGTSVEVRIQVRQTTEEFPLPWRP